MASRTIKSLYFSSHVVQYLTNGWCHFMPAAVLTSALTQRRIGYLNYSTNNAEKNNQDKGTEAKKKKPPIPKITLLSTDGIMSVVSLEEAQKLSKRRDLKLLKVSDSDSKHQRAVYKLLTESQFLKEEMGEKDLKKVKKDTGFKGSKLLPLTTKIGQHDLNARLKNISKWLEKNYEVRVVISAEDSDQTKSEKIYDEIATHLKNEGRIVQKRFKGSDLKFQILPPKKETKEE